MTACLTQFDAECFLYREAQLLDRGEWDRWLDLYCEDAIFWIPAWRDEIAPTRDPDTELSLIYYRGKRNLEDRVWRARSGFSVASTPRSRVVHLVSNVLIEHAEGAETAVSASFCTHLYDRRSDRSHAFFGQYEYLIRQSDDLRRIAMKKILLLNDTIPTVIDFYSV